VLTFKTCNYNQELDINFIEDKPKTITKQNFKSSKCKGIRLKKNKIKEIQNKINNN
jgi:hypothetical protein